MPLSDEIELAFREREIAVKEQEQRTREGELSLKREEEKASSWRNPLVVAILAGALAATGNALISVYNGHSQRQLDQDRAEQSRILEMLKTNGNADQAAKNLQFLLDANLITDPDFRARLSNFLKNRVVGTGPTLVSQDPGQQLGTPLISNARVYLLTGHPDSMNHLDDLSSQLKLTGYAVLGAKYIVDTGRPDTPEIRYFNSVDKAQADVLVEFLKFSLNRKDVGETIYTVSTARPGYIEVWLGR